MIPKDAERKVKEKKAVARGRRSRNGGRAGGSPYRINRMGRKGGWEGGGGPAGFPLGWGEPGGGRGVGKGKGKLVLKCAAKGDTRGGGEGEFREWAVSRRPGRG